MAGLASLASKMGTAAQDELKSAAYLIVLDEEDNPSYTFAFQYFPETITDAKEVNWQTKEIPGGSLPMYQWAASGARTVSFTATFTADIDYGKGVFPEDRLKTAGQLNRNVDIRAAVYELRRLMLPNYTGGLTRAPPKMLLYLPRSGIGLVGGNTQLTQTNTDSIVCVMTSCEVTWEKFFTSGAPRIATVSLAFAQVPQYKGVVAFPKRGGRLGIATPTSSGGGAGSGGYRNAIRPYVLASDVSAGTASATTGQGSLAVARVTTG